MTPVSINSRTKSQPNTTGRRLKIAVIGAGSAQFSLGIIRDLCLSPSFAGSLVTFMDIDQTRLDAITNLARRYAGELGVDLQIEPTLNREAALQDADFVLNTAAQPHHEEEQQRALYEFHGYYRGARVYHLNLELMLSVARDVERICPNAWLLQIGNPVFEGCTLMTRETAANVVGLCHGYHGVFKIARVLGLDESAVTFQAPGVNHCIWMTEFRYRGEDAYPLIDRWIAEQAETYWQQKPRKYSDVQMSRAAIDMYRTFGYMPIGDTPRFGGSQFVSSWWYHTDLETKKRWYGDFGGFDSEFGWAGYLQDLDRSLAAIMEVAADKSRSVTEAFPATPSDEQFIPLIDALANDRPGIFQVNVPNNGAIDAIADDVAVELPALCSAAGGIQPLKIASFPRRLLTRVLWPKILEMELNLDGFTSGDIRAWLHQLLLDHRTQNLEHAIEALEAVLNLPFNAPLRERFGYTGSLRHLLPPPVKEAVTA